MLYIYIQKEKNTKEMYINLIIEKTKPPRSIKTWINLYPFLEQYDWKKIYKITFKYMREPYLQSFQYKILNRIKPMKSLKIGPSNSQIVVTIVKQ